MRISKKRGLGEPEVKLLSAEEAEKYKKENHAKHTFIYTKPGSKK